MSRRTLNFAHGAPSGQVVVSYANGREIVIIFGQEEAPALALRSGLGALWWPGGRCAGRPLWADGGA